MSVRKSALIFLIASLLIFSSVTATVMTYIMESGFRELEIRKAKDDTARIVKFFDEAARQLSTKAQDWSIWEELWQFAQDGNAKFYKENVTTEIMKTLKISFLGVTDINGEVRIGAEFIKADGRLVETTSLTKDINAILPSLRADDLEADMSGLFLVSGRPWIIGARPIRHSDGTGPVAGTVIFAQEFDQEMLDLASKTIEMTLRFSDATTSAEYLDNQQKNDKSRHDLTNGAHAAAIITPNAENMRTHVILRSSPERSESNPTIDGVTSRNHDVVHIVRDSNRDIMLLGQTTTKRIVATSAILALVGWLLYFGVIWHSAIKKITKLETNLEQITTLDANSVSQIKHFVHPGSENEIDRLAEKIAAMMQRAAAAEQDRDKAQSELTKSAKMALLGEMAGGIAHEINNPLTVINGRARMLRILIETNKLSAENGLPLIESLEKTSDRIASIVKALRIHSRSDDSSPYRLANIAEAIHGTLDLCREQLRTSGIDMRMEIDPNLPMIPCQDVLLGQVMLNLIKNAMDAVENIGDEEKWIAVTIRMRTKSKTQPSNTDSTDWLEIRIANGGAKIPIQTREKLFQPFFTTKPVGKGTGLGLSLSASIIHRHKGRIYFDDVEPNTCFVIELPRDPALPIENDARPA